MPEIHTAESIAQAIKATAFFLGDASFDAMECLRRAASAGIISSTPPLALTSLTQFEMSCLDLWLLGLQRLMLSKTAVELWPLLDYHVTGVKQRTAEAQYAQAAVHAQLLGCGAAIASNVIQRVAAEVSRLETVDA
jgi:hypothetical protein